MSILTITKLMATKLLRMEEGNIELFGRLGFIMPVEVLLRMHEEIESSHGKEEADRVLFDAGFFQTYSGTLKYLENKKRLSTMYDDPAATGNPSLDMARDMLRLTGLGEMRVRHQVQGGGRIIGSTKNSPFALEYVKTRGKAKAPVCHYLRGIMAGAAKAFYKADFESSETCCVATGMCQECVFEFRMVQKRE